MVLSPSLSFSDSFSLYLSTPFYFSFPRTLTLYYNPLLSSSLSDPLFFGPVARATLSRSGTARVRPRASYHLTFPRPRANSPVLCVYAPPRAAARPAANRGIVGALGYFCAFAPSLRRR